MWRRAARAYLAIGIAKGDRVAIWAPNMWEWMVVAMGAHAAGAVVVPVNTRYKGIEAAFLLKKSGARALVTVSGFLGNDYPALLAAAGEELPALDRTIILRGDVGDGSESLESFLARADEVSEETLDARLGELGSDDLADVLFTSGTTGQPKGAMCTHAQNLRTFRAWSHIVGLAPAIDT